MIEPRPQERLRVLHWTTAPPGRRRLQQEGYRVLSFARLARLAAAARPAGGLRSSLANPAAGLLDIYARHPQVAVLGVVCRTVADLQLIHGFLLEPAFRAGCRLLIGADRGLESLAPAEFHDPQWRCPWTLERLRHLAARYAEPATVTVAAPVPRWRQALRKVTRHRNTGPLPVPRLDPEQNAAVAAGDGVVQVIAPAGSGKTTVLVERVRELCRRGTPPERVLCSTFNRDACTEMAARLARDGVQGVQVRSFHGLGLSILKEEKLLRRDIGTLEETAWRQLAREAAAAEPGCGVFDAAAAQNAVSRFKLAEMVTPRQACLEAAGRDALARAEARVFVHYQHLLQQRGLLDFDDLIAQTIALLQQDHRVRERWQARFERVLVDEYQDIEPAQALLIGLLAAPHDSLFCVGDEDQCIYAWRRASVQRVIDLDQTYPGLERYPLVRNYRCGRRITHASRRLIRHNRRRFRKPLHAGVTEPGRIEVWPQPDLKAGAVFVATQLRTAEPGQVAVLARTGSLLAEVTAAWIAVGGAPPDADGRLGGCELATVHGSKGREWERVILHGADEGHFPLARVLREEGTAEGAGGLEDERRLFYVALTRARRRLDIVCSAGSPSRFLKEAGLKAG